MQKIYLIICKAYPTLKAEIPKAATFGKKLKTLAEKYCAREGREYAQLFNRNDGISSYYIKQRQ